MTDSTEYQLIQNEDGRRSTWNDYPGNRRDDFPEEKISNKQSQGEGGGSLMVRTGGNALQTLDDASSSDGSNQGFINVVIPEGRLAGDIILVNCPYVEGRLIEVTIPKGTVPGDTMLVQASIPVDPNDEEAVRTSNRDMLAAAAKKELANRKHDDDDTEASSTNDDTEKTVSSKTNQQEPSGPENKGWVALMFLGKLMLG